MATVRPTLKYCTNEEYPLKIKHREKCVGYVKETMCIEKLIL